MASCIAAYRDSWLARLFALQRLDRLVRADILRKRVVAPKQVKQTLAQPPEIVGTAVSTRRRPETTNRGLHLEVGTLPGPQNPPSDGKAKRICLVVFNFQHGRARLLAQEDVDGASKPLQCGLDHLSQGPGRVRRACHFVVADLPPGRTSLAVA